MTSSKMGGGLKRMGFFSTRRPAAGALHPAGRLPLPAGMLVLLLVSLLLSCSTPAGRNNQTDAGKTEKGASGRDRDYQLGDVRLEGGIEYIYVKNRKFGVTPYEPEREWIRKDEYSPRIFEGLVNRIMNVGDKKETEELEKRIAALEAEVKGGAAPSGSPPPKTAGLPAPAPARLPAAVPAPAVADSRLKKRVLVLPVKDETGPGEGHFDDLALTRLASVLESTGAAICVDARSIEVPKDPLTGEALEALGMQGVQAIVRARVEAPEPAFLTVSLDIYDMETVTPLRRLAGRTSVETNMQEPDRVKAVDHAINLIKDDLVKTIRSLDWRARVVSIDKGATMLNAGRLSGVKEGDVLEVFGRGEQVVDRVTGLPLGRLKGAYKGEIEVVRIAGVDASWARTVKGGPFLRADLVYIKK